MDCVLRVQAPSTADPTPGAPPVGTGLLPDPEGFGLIAIFMAITTGAGTIFALLMLVSLRER